MSQLRGMVQGIKPQHRVIILVGVIVAVIIYYLNVLTTTGTIEQGIVDWGLDQGTTQLAYGILLVVVCVILLIYPYQKIIRNKTITRFHVFLTGGIFLFVIIGAFAFQWLAHDPVINFYHNYPLGEDFRDKIAHFIGSFIITFILVFFSQTKLAVIVAWCIPTLYELFEIIVNYQAILKGMGSTTGLFQEIADVPFDIVANTLGWALAIVIIIYIFKKPIR